MRWVIFLLCLCSGTFFASEPERILESGQYQTSLYLREVHEDAKGKIALRLVWIPETIQQQCLGKSFEECQNRDHCRTFRTVQKCDADLSHCVETTHPDCLTFPVLPKTQPTAPHRILDYLLVDATLVSVLVKRWKLSPPPSGKETKAYIQDRFRTGARVKWELWTNGENFSVVSISN